MATISTALRKFQEPTRDELTRLFFSLPSDVSGELPLESGSGSGSNAEKSGAGMLSSMSTRENAERGEMEINAVLSLAEEGLEDSYVRVLFASPR